MANITRLAMVASPEVAAHRIGGAAVRFTGNGWPCVPRVLICRKAGKAGNQSPGHGQLLTVRFECVSYRCTCCASNKNCFLRHRCPRCA